MGSEKLPLRQLGIYHNIPDYDPSIKDLTAIITGANGLSGFSTLRILLEAPNRWIKIYALSRRPPPEKMMELLSPEQRKCVHHVACDFLESGEKIAHILKSANVTATYIFFYSYLQPKSNPEASAKQVVDELTRVNGALLSNFLDALPLANIRPKRIMLQTGAKNYGIHLGRTRAPNIESDPQPKHLEFSFYYVQEERLFQYCKEYDVGWNVIMPAWIIGAVNNAQMNALYPFSVYAAIQAYKKEPLIFSGDFNAWQDLSFHSTAKLTGYLAEWAVLEDKCRNQRFNSTDTSPFSWDRFYYELARWFGVDQGVVPPPEDEDRYQEIIGKPGNETPLGYGPPTVTRISTTLTAWARDPVNGKAWWEIMKYSKGKLTHDPFEDIEDSFASADAARLTVVLCPNKSRRLGWTGFVDTFESVFETFQEMEYLGMAAPMKVDSPHALI